jgi:hypothetical protein
MSKFITKRNFSLSFLGEGWENAFIIFSSISVKEFRELTAEKLDQKEASQIVNITSDFLKKHFIEGVGFDSEKKELVKLKKLDLEELPSDITQKAIVFLVGGAT